MTTTQPATVETGERDETPRPVSMAVRHCGDTYKACCLPWGWCHCTCGDCRVAKYAALGDKQ